MIGADAAFETSGGHDGNPDPPPPPPSHGRGALRVLLGLIAIPLTPTSIALFAHHFGSYIDVGGCETAGGTGTIWAVAEGLSALVGVCASLLFACNIWAYDDPEDRPASNRVLSCALLGLVIFAALLTVIPRIHPCA